MRSLVRHRTCLWIVVALIGLAGPQAARSQQQAVDDAGPRAPADAAHATLGINDPAPPLQVSAWPQGEPLADGLQAGRIYVIEFWATWCGPCRVSMPHISDLQQKYGERVTFVGVTREDAATVDGFLSEEQSAGKTWRDVVKYRLALDQADATNTAYMRAAQQSGIPTAFLVGKDGRIEWIGHPMALDEPLAKVVAGEWDREAALTAYKQDQVVKQLVRKLSVLARAEQWDAALQALADAEKEHGANSKFTQLHMTLLQLAGRTEDLAKLQNQYVEQAWNDPQALNDFAWRVALTRGERNLDLALKAAAHAAELTSRQDASILDTLARVQFEQGDFAQALATQKEAVALNKGAIPQIDEALQRYLEATGKSEPKP